MKKISIALAVYNEEENIEQCLRSVNNLAWEIVIVDGESTDKTIDIAKKFNARIIRTKNLQNFHINKNKAIDAACGDWILQLDADEIVTKELADEIMQAISKDGGINGYWIPRKNLFLGRFLTKGGQYPDYTLRLYKRGKGRLPGKDVHEQAVIKGKVGYLSNDLLHLRDKNFTIYMHRFNRYTDLLASQWYNNGLPINLVTFISYILIKPHLWFIKSYIRYRGYVDGFPGFVFALFSSFRFPVAYFKLWGKSEDSN